MLPQHSSQRRQHVRQRWLDLVRVPGLGFGQQRRFLERTPRITHLDERHQHHRQRRLRAKRALELDKLLKKLSKYDALMIDDFGYVKQDRDEMEVLFTLLAYRYERGSLLLTSNLPFSKWEVIFKDPMTTTAAIDRLIHHSVVLELNVPSYRAEEAKKRKNNDTTGPEYGPL